MTYVVNSMHQAQVVYVGDGDPPTTDTHTSQPIPDPTTPPFGSTQCEECLSCSTSTLLASVLTAIITALLATAIFLPVLVAVRKCHPNFTPGGAKTGTSAGEGEGQEYEQMDMGEGGVATSDPTYISKTEHAPLNFSGTKLIPLALCIASSPGSLGEKKEPGTHCLRMCRNYVFSGLLVQKWPPAALA